MEHNVLSSRLESKTLEWRAEDSLEREREEPEAWRCFLHSDGDGGNPRTGHRTPEGPCTLHTAKPSMAAGPPGPQRGGEPSGLPAAYCVCRTVLNPEPCPCVVGLTSSNLHQAEKEISHIKKYLCHLQPNGNSKACLPVSGKGTYKRPGEISYLDGASARWRMLVPGEGTRAFDKWRL